MQKSGNIKEYLENILMAVSNDQERTAFGKNFDLKKFSKYLKQYKGNIENIIDDFYLTEETTQKTALILKLLIRAENQIIKTPKFKIEKCFEDDNKNPLKIFSQIFARFAKCDLYFSESKINFYTTFFYKLAIACKKHLKLYFSLTVKKLQTSVDLVINELRNCFIEYSKNESYEGLLISLNQIFWVYFQINQFQQCTHILANVSSELDQMLSHGKKAHSVTLLYYIGRMNLFEGNYKKAEFYLDQAFENCHSKFISHNIKILRFLIPVKILLGKLPSEKLFEFYTGNLKEFEEMVKAVKNTDLKGLQDIREKYKKFWINHGLYFLIDKIEMILYRNMLKTYWSVKGKNPILDTEEINKVFNWRSGEEYEIEEIECIIGNLIFKGYLRGYVFTDQKKVVLSKDKGFVPLKNVVIK